MFIEIVHPGFTLIVECPRAFFLLPSMRGAVEMTSFFHDPLHRFNQTLCLIRDVGLSTMVESDMLCQGEFPKSLPANLIFIAKQNAKGDWCRVAVGCSSIARIQGVFSEIAVRCVRLEDILEVWHHML